jgi:threonine/homoserine/homoserine lactone efflux protein
MSPDPGLLARGAILGFTIAAAVGPIALLIIRRTLASGWSTGMASGLGVATADGIYGAIAAFGITAISGPLVALADPLGLLGGALLVVIGIRTLRAPPADHAATATTARRGLGGAWLSILGLTLTNPMTILLFASIVVNMGLSGSTADAALVTLGFFVGSLGWWLVLVSAVAALRTRITGRVLHGVTVVSGALIALYGVIAIVAVVRS